MRYLDNVNDILYNLSSEIYLIIHTFENMTVYG
jgi:hypothetical protein